MLMTLADGDVVQYQALQKMSAENFLIKFDEHITQVERAQKKTRQWPRPKK